MWAAHISVPYLSVIYFRSLPIYLVHYLSQLWLPCCPTFSSTALSFSSCSCSNVFCSSILCLAPINSFQPPISSLILKEMHRWHPDASPFTPHTMGIVSFTGRQGSWGESNGAFTTIRECVRYDCTNTVCRGINSQGDIQTRVAMHKTSDDVRHCLVSVKALISTFNIPVLLGILMQQCVAGMKFAIIIQQA